MTNSCTVHRVRHILYTKPFAVIYFVLFLIMYLKLSWCTGLHFGLPCRESWVQITAELILIKDRFCSFSSPWTKTIILLLHSVKVLEPYRIQSAHDQGYVKLKMDSVEGWAKAKPGGSLPVFPNSNKEWEKDECASFFILTLILNFKKEKKIQ